MKCLIILLTLYSLSDGLPSAFQTRIVGGEETVITTVPYQLSLEFKNKHICGAVIITRNWALTSAQCVQDLDKYNKNYYTLRSGSSDRETGGSLSNIDSVFLHPKFDKGSLSFDIALIKTQRSFPVRDDGVRAIKLAPAGYIAKPGTMATVSGWGITTYDGKYSPKLQRVDVPIDDVRRCRENLENFDSSMICAGWAEGGHDACKGDVGGPLAVGRSYLIGISSWGYGCGLPGSPGVYASVAVKETRDWIEELTGI